jgi:hypothetical protein
VTDVEATIFAITGTAMLAVIPILAADLVKQIRRTTREYRARTLTGRRIE